MSSPLAFARKYAVAAAGSLYLFTFGVRSRRHRALLTAISAHFGFDERETVPLAIRQVPLGDIVPPDTRIELREPLAVDGNVTLYELVAIASIVTAQRPLTIFEIGTFDGRTTLNLAANATPATQVHTLDLPRGSLDSARLALDPDDVKYVEKDISGARFRGSDCEPRIQQLYGDSASFDLTPFEDATDLVFVDGAHSYDYVLSDSRRAQALLRGGRGAILWHDYGQWPGVTRALNELAATDARFAGLRHIAGTSLVYLRSG